MLLYFPALVLAGLLAAAAATPCAFPGCPGGFPCNNFNASFCASQVCGTNGLCRDPSCTDRRKNWYETGLDCGGYCEGCDAFGLCNTPGDCKSKYCGNSAIDSTVRCKPATCSDDTHNGKESDVDCGKACCETWDDADGAPCPHLCGVGLACTADSDCSSGSTCKPFEDFGKFCSATPPFKINSIYTTRLTAAFTFHGERKATFNTSALARALAHMLDLFPFQVLIEGIVEERRPFEIGPTAYVDIIERNRGQGYLPVRRLQQAADNRTERALQVGIVQQPYFISSTDLVERLTVYVAAVVDPPEALLILARFLNLTTISVAADGGWPTERLMWKYISDYTEKFDYCNTYMNASTVGLVQRGGVNCSGYFVQPPPNSNASLWLEKELENRTKPWRNIPRVTFMQLLHEGIQNLNISWQRTPVRDPRTAIANYQRPLELRVIKQPRGTPLEPITATYRFPIQPKVAVVDRLGRPVTRWRDGAIRVSAFLDPVRFPRARSSIQLSGTYQLFLGEDGSTQFTDLYIQKNVTGVIMWFEATYTDGSILRRVNISSEPFDVYERIIPVVIPPPRVPLSPYIVGGIALGVLIMLALTIRYCVKRRIKRMAAKRIYDEQQLNLGIAEMKSRNVPDEEEYVLHPLPQEHHTSESVTVADAMQQAHPHVATALPQVPNSIATALSRLDHMLGDVEDSDPL